MQAADRTTANIGVIAVGAMVANVFSYLVHLPATLFFSAQAYGEFAVLLQLLLVLAVPALALQTVAARDTARGVESNLIRAAARQWMLVVCAASAVAIPVAVAVAHTSWWATIAVAGAAPALAILGVEQGIIQGRGEFGRLAKIITWIALCRMLPVIIALCCYQLLSRFASNRGGHPNQFFSETFWLATSLTAGTIGAWVIALVLAVKSKRENRSLLSKVIDNKQERGSSWTSVLQASQVQLVIIVLSSIDLFLARHVLSFDDAGRYALGAIATKIAFWLPQAIVLVMFPKFANEEFLKSRKALQQSQIGIVGCGLVVVASAAILGPIVPKILGPEYQSVSGILWAFAVIGLGLAIIQLGLLYSVGQQRYWATVLGWIAVAVLACLLFIITSGIESMLLVVISVIGFTALLVSVSVIQPRSTSL